MLPAAALSGVAQMAGGRGAGLQPLSLGGALVSITEVPLTQFRPRAAGSSAWASGPRGRGLARGSAAPAARGGGTSRGARGTAPARPGFSFLCEPGRAPGEL